MPYSICRDTSSEVSINTATRNGFIYDEWYHIVLRIAIGTLPKKDSVLPI